MSPSTVEKPVRIGCYSAFWGDSAEAALQLVELEGANLDYLVADYLAEITMGILAARRKRRLMMGGEHSKSVDYIAEFLYLVLRRILPDVAKNGTKIITNAGALDPLACKVAIEALLREMQITNIQVAAVTGDDVLADKEVSTLESFPDIVSFSPLSATQHTLEAERMPTRDEPIVSLNAYLGARGIAAALASGAQIVVTGRVVDSALVVGPLMHEYGWQPDQPNYYDLLASASLAGHIIECGCHSTGGNFTDWKLAAFSEHGGYANMGYPIVEFAANGEFVVTKPDKTGGLVSTATVAEQILYEILDPALYLLPDVILDMRQVQLSQIGPHRVHVAGARGLQPTPWLKCSGIFLDGWKLSGDLLIGGHQAKQKALAVGNAIHDRVRKILKQRGMADFRNFNVEPMGGESLYGPNATPHETREVVLRLTGHHDDPKALRILAMEIVPSVTCMAPGITGGSGRPKPLPNLVHFPCLLPKTSVTTHVIVGEAGRSQTVAWEPTDTNHNFGSPEPVALIPQPVSVNPGTLVKTKLLNLAYGRSGDKGDVCNVGIIARDPAYLPFIKRSLTESVIKAYMGHLCKGTVKRYELPGLHAMNFVLTKSLGGGGLSSLLIDRQGKTFAQLVLSGIDIEIPADLVPKHDHAKL
ncbi:uncharacterized protein BYT42DRAFT_502004 [Radiomyces spectabilis]|uniref:uncharacterized protein n=1 Tax=Radiomyces spectabilis TaxID=64574 RepID=UPI002221212F|nr:uncharacterized protein BYT42DRAFT_502004 [Radiomyces spectabilis]KAI8371766.1 hypothetical protein BYT42DRAFT_502004 [Radiomyces spectabilis]